MSIAQFAAATGLGTATIAEIERGKRHPRTDTIETIARVLGIRMAWLFEGGPIDFEAGK